MVCKKDVPKDPNDKPDVDVIIEDCGLMPKDCKKTLAWPVFKR